MSEISVQHVCDRCGTEAREFAPLTPTGWLYLTTPYAEANKTFAVLCDGCAVALHQWLHQEDANG